MAIRLKAFPSELKITPPPFDFMMAAAQEHQKRLDAVDKSIGTMQGQYAGLTAAPGHEPWAKGVTDDFQGRLNTLMAENPDLLSREGTRKLAKLNSEWVGNQDVKDITQSYDWWSKNGDKIWASQTKGDIIKAPGVLNVARNDQGQFDYGFKENRKKYDWNTFGVTPYAPITETLNKEFAIVKPRVAESMGYETKIIDGKEHYFDTKTHTEVKDEKLFEPTVKALKNLILENPESNEAFRYINGSAGYEQDSPAYVENIIRKHVTPFYSEDISKTKTHIGSQGSGNDTEETKPKALPANIGAITTITRPYLDDANGNPILTTGQLDAAITENNKKVLVSKGAITLEFPELDALQKLKGTKQKDGSIHPGAFTIDPNTGFEVINEKLVGPVDAIKKEQFNKANIKLNNAQVAQRAFTNKKAYFLEQSGFDANLPINKQMEPGIVEKGKVAGVDAINNPYESFLYTHDDTGNGTPTFMRTEMLANYGGINPLEDDKFIYTNNKGHLVSRLATGVGNANLQLSNVDNMQTHLKAVEDWINTNGTAEQKGRLKTFTKSREEKTNPGILRAFEIGQDDYLKENSPKYKKFSDLLENDLNTAGQLSVFNYTFTGDDLTRLKDATMVAAKAGNVDKLRFDLGNNKPFKYDSDGATNKAKLLKEEVIQSFWNNSNTTYSPRYDEYTNQWVVDVIGTKGAFTVNKVEGIPQLVGKVDPNFTNQYLSSQKKFFGELDASEGSYATLVSPNKDGSISNMIVRKAEQTHGDIQEDSYMFTVPELAGKVLVAKNYDPIYRFMEMYNLEKTRPNPNITNLVTDGLSSGQFNLDIKDESYGGIGSLYFPTPKSKVYYVGK